MRVHVVQCMYKFIVEANVKQIRRGNVFCISNSRQKQLRVGERERERERDRQTDRQTDRQRQTETDRQTDRQTEMIQKKMPEDAKK